MTFTQDKWNLNSTKPRRRFERARARGDLSDHHGFLTENCRRHTVACYHWCRHSLPKPNLLFFTSLFSLITERSLSFYDHFPNSVENAYWLFSSPDNVKGPENNWKTSNLREFLNTRIYWTIQYLEYKNYSQSRCLHPSTGSSVGYGPLTRSLSLAQIVPSPNFF